MIATGEPPIVIITTNEERVLPDAFVRRCLVTQMRLPRDRKSLIALLEERGRAHFGDISGELLNKAARLLAEVGRLRPWAAETRRRRGRTTFGLSGADPDQIDDVARALVSVAEAGDIDTPPEADIAWAHEMPLLLRHLAEDVRSYYHEAIAAQPGETPPNHDALNEWIFGQTVLGEVLVALGDQLTAAADDNPFAPLIRNFIIPEGHYRGIANFEGIAGGYKGDGG